MSVCGCVQNRVSRPIAVVTGGCEPPEVDAGN